MNNNKKINLLGKSKKNLENVRGRIVIAVENSIDPSKEILYIKKVTDSDLQHDFLAIITSDPNYNEELSIEKNIVYISDEVDSFQLGDIVEFLKLKEDNVLIQRIFRADSLDNAIFLTNMCNSNCVFCPDAIEIRSNKKVYTEEILKMLPLYPKFLKHITITGGEPTLLGEDFFMILEKCKEELPDVNFTLLSNGRMFFYKDFCKKYFEKKPKKTKVAIPIHGSTRELHDKLSGVKESYIQTLVGIKQLLDLGENIEVRIVLNKENIDDLENIAKLIVMNFVEVKEVNIMSLELTGSAAKDYKRFWVEKELINLKLKKAVITLIKAGIRVQLYNFPLCYIDYEYWPLVRKSITDYKRKYSENCNSCKEKEKCGGFFRSTYDVLNAKVYPIR